jgi:hypothetical protein
MKEKIELIIDIYISSKLSYFLVSLITLSIDKKFIEWIIKSLAIYIIISLFCMCVWPAIDSAPGGHRDLSPVSLDPVWPEGVPLRKNFHKKWTVAELLKKKDTPVATPVNTGLF